ncbi:MAG: hypothetical protein H0T91_11645 [Propionibacteriaceae bacterium]|nr:hypothetical protein [Propionibacteriaceae bacterium]
MATRLAHVDIALALVILLVIGIAAIGVAALVLLIMLLVRPSGQHVGANARPARAMNHGL